MARTPVTGSFRAIRDKRKQNARGKKTGARNRWEPDLFDSASLRFMAGFPPD
jgi:hypothetical protein